jgi:hypothetical protein
MTLESDRPSVEHVEPCAQLAISSLPFLETSLPDGQPWMAFYRRNGNYLVRFADLVDFEIFNDGMQIIVHAVPGVSSHTIEHLYQNQALPLALSLRKMLVLHGSAVEIDSKAVAFLAETGRGKSTLAASFSSNGLRFLTDDGLLIEKMGGKYVVQPSHPSIRLWEDSREALAKQVSVIAPSVDYNKKARFLADKNFLFCSENRPLKHVYFLGDGSSKDVTINAVGGQLPTLEMLKHCFLLGVDKREILAHNFEQLAELSRLPIFFSLDYPRRYDMLDRVRQAVTEHVQSQRS